MVMLSLKVVTVVIVVDVLDSRRPVPVLPWALQVPRNRHIRTGETHSNGLFRVAQIIVILQQ